MVEVEATYEYIAEQPDELTIKVGDIIKNVIQSEGGWWEGELKGKKGMFPDNFVKVLKDGDKDKKEEVVRREPKKDIIQASKRQSVKDLANRIKDKVHDGPAPVRKKVKKRAKVVFAYEPENEDELKLQVGDSVEILKQEEEGWWEGIVNGKQGMIPSNFVEIVDESEPSTVEPVEKAEAGDGEGHIIKGKKIHGVGLGNIFGDGPIKLRSTTGNKPLDKPIEPVRMERPTQEPIERRPKETKPVQKALVRYSYKAENEDELSLTEGEVINVLDKELEDSGWWKGELNGQVGVFPDNFVEPMEEEVKPQVPTHPEKAPRPVIAPSAQPKPKRPQLPPAQVPMTKPAAPKLPDKAPVTDHHKPEHVKEEKPVVIPAKKPPPLTKKPVKLTETDDDKGKSDQVHGTTGSFEAVEPVGEKLTHLTASRARGPAKRPPSQPKHNASVVKEEERNGDVKDSHWLKDDRTAHVPPTLPEKKEERHPHSVPFRPADPPSVNPALQIAIDELKREVSELRSNSVSKTAFNELKAENEKLRQDLDSVKANYSRRLKDIMLEVDEEKKIRLSTQVEIERIRKLVAESHV